MNEKLFSLVEQIGKVLAKEWVPASIPEIRPNRQAPAVLVLSTQMSSGHLFCHKGCRTGGGDAQFRLSFASQCTTINDPSV